MIKFIEYIIPDDINSESSAYTSLLHNIAKIPHNRRLIDIFINRKASFIKMCNNKYPFDVARELIMEYEKINSPDNIILDFIKQNKRKIYGGYAVNKLIIDKNQKDSIYQEYQYPDIDFYSPTPIEDLINICNTLYDKGYKRVNAKEAAHKDTYSIFVNFHLYCDITYVPKNIYNRIPYKELNNYYYTHPHFMTIDYLRMLADPLGSSWRIEKSIKRFALLQKYYPLPIINKPISMIEINKLILI